MSVAAVRAPAGVRDVIVPWRLPAPDSEASPAYREAVAQIYAYSETPRTREQVALAQRRKLDRMRALLQLIGTPQAAFSTVLVAGTKGKGSMAAFLASILSAAGYRVGRYTQPHLYSYRERTWAVGDYIGEIALRDAFEAMEEGLTLITRRKDELGHLTTFDVGTALSLLHFARSRVQVAVVEVGVGGANDATNALEPILSVIGPVGLDHMEVLGPTLTDIARQKFGIARRGGGVVVGRQDPEALAVIREEAARLDVRVWELGQELSWRAGDADDDTFDVIGPVGEVPGLHTRLAGAFQRDNAAVAVAAIQVLAQRGWPVSEDAIRRGIADVEWPGRFQTVVAAPLTIVDGAHNPTSMRALAVALEQRYPGRPITAVVGMSDSKDVVGTLTELAPVVRKAIFTRSGQWPERAVPPDELAAAARGLGIDSSVAATSSDALIRAWESQPSDGVTVATGSLFLVGDVLEWLWGQRV